MKTRPFVFAVAFHLLGAAALFGASAKTYQVTGPIVSLNESTLVVQKGDEQWEIARDAKTKSDSNLKVGQKVTVRYRMTATDIDVKTTGTLSEPDTTPGSIGSVKSKATAAGSGETSSRSTK